MHPYRPHRADLLSAKEIDAYLKSNDIAILPVGCFEMHGPHIPVACDAYEEWAMDLLLAERWRGLVFPPVFYTYPGFTAKWPGTIEIDSQLTAAYLKQIISSLSKGGFKRIFISCAHYPMVPVLKTLVQEMFLETGIAVMHLALIPGMIPSEETQRAFGLDWGEDLLLLGSLRILGLHGAYDPQAFKNLPRDLTNDGLAAFGELRSELAVPQIFQDDARHTGIRPGLSLSDADRVVEIMRHAAQRYDDLPAQFAAYQQELAALSVKAPWNKPSWSE